MCARSAALQRGRRASASGHGARHRTWFLPQQDSRPQGARMASACPASSARVGGPPRRPGGAASVFLPCSLRSGRTAVGSARLPGDAEPGPVTVTYTGPLNSSAFQDRRGSQARGRGATRACRGPCLAYGLIAVACVIHGRVLGPHSSPLLSGGDQVEQGPHRFRCPGFGKCVCRWCRCCLYSFSIQVPRKPPRLSSPPFFFFFLDFFLTNAEAKKIKPKYSVCPISYREKKSPSNSKPTSHRL